MNNNSKVSKLPEMINHQTGLRELRMRRYDCLHGVSETNPLNCATNEEIVTEPKPTTTTTNPAPVSTSQDNLRVNELTPWLDKGARTVVNPTVMFNDVTQEIFVTVFLRVVDPRNNQIKDLKYEFNGDLKAFKQNSILNESKNLNLELKKAESKEVLNALVHCFDAPKCHDLTLVVSFLNYKLDGQSFVDSRPFMIDQREPEFKAEDGIPNKATRTLDEPEYEEEEEIVEEEDIHNEDVLLDPEDDPNMQAPLGPIINLGNIEGLCKGLIASSEVCPEYLLDSSKIKPNQRELLPRPRPKTQMGQNTSGESTLKNTGELVSEIEEEVFPEEALVLDPTKPRKRETQIQLPEAKIFNPEPYYEFVSLLQEHEANKAKDTEDSRTGQILSRKAVIRPLPRPSGLAAPVYEDSRTQQILDRKATLGPRPRPGYMHDTEDSRTGQILSRKAVTRPLPRPGNLSPVETEKDESVAMNDPNGALALIPFVSIDGRFTYDLSLCGPHLIKAKNKTYNQARGLYSAGSLRDASHYTVSSYKTVHHEPTRKNKQYTSEITRQVIEFAGCVLEQRYGTNLNNQINNLSLKRGGNIGGQGSHQNGLDADVSYPHLYRRTTGFDNFAGQSSTERTVAALDQARLLIYTDRVLVLYTDNRVRTKFCKYLKNTSQLDKYRDVVERYMRHWKGHHNHYHVRVECTQQNQGCTYQPKYNKSKYCDN